MKLIFSLLLTCLIYQTAAQQYLVVKKRNNARLVFQSGDQLKFKVKGEKHWRRQLIIGFLENGIRFHYFDINLNDIEQIAIPIEDRNYGIPNVLIYAGIGFFVIDQFNQTVVNEQELDPNQSTIIVALTGIGTGFLWKLLKRKKYSVDGSRFRLETTDFIP